MAYPVYSIRIFAVGSLAPVSGKVGPVVPDGLVYVLRDIDVVLRTAAPATLEVWGPLLSQLLLFIPDSSLGPDSGYHWRGRQVYGPGEQVGFQSAGGSWDIMASGYQLTLP